MKGEEITDKEKIITIFEKYRKVPGAKYHEENFLDYWVAGPKQKRAVYNSFSGLRRLNAFINEIQLEFSICFSEKDREANYSLDKLVSRIKELKASPNASLASLRNQMKHVADWNLLIVLNAIIFILSLWLKTLVSVILAVLINCGLLHFYISERNYKKRLFESISQRKKA